MEPGSNLQVFRTPEEMAEACSKFIVDIAKHSVETRGKFIVALSGGNTPELLYTLLSKPPFRDSIPWSKTFVFWGDERYVPASDERNNSHMAKAALLDHVDIPLSNIFQVPVGLSPVEAAKKYELTVKDFFGNGLPKFDLILLGLGENGHTASLFPGSDVLTDTTHLVKEVYLADQEMFRITMTAKLINDARNILFLISGEGKAKIFDSILNAPYQPDKYPAQLIKPVDGKLYWFADNKAVSLLDKR